MLGPSYPSVSFGEPRFSFFYLGYFLPDYLPSSVNLGLRTGE